MCEIKKTKDEIKDDLIKRISTARSEGDRWFEIKITLPFDDSEIDMVKALEKNMAGILSQGLELMVKEDMQKLPEEFPSIILPN